MTDEEQQARRTRRFYGARMRLSGPIHYEALAGLAFAHRRSLTANPKTHSLNQAQYSIFSSLLSDAFFRSLGRTDQRQPTPQTSTKL
jgi:hypothetical protein